MLPLHWLTRMRRWITHPPSPGRFALVLAVILACLALYGLEQAGLLPDWFQADRAARHPPLPVQ